MLATLNRSDGTFERLRFVKTRRDVELEYHERSRGIKISRGLKRHIINGDRNESTA